MKKIHLLPNLLTLANAFVGLLAVAKGIDALAYGGGDPAIFYAKMERACFLIFLGMVFDALDGRVARLTHSSSPFGAQLDSFSDLVTFGVAPALLAKILIEHEGPLVGYDGSPRLHFLAAAAFTLLAILRLVRFNLESEEESGSHSSFEGLPSPAAAGTVTSTIWLYLILRLPELERVDGTPTPFHRLLVGMDAVNWQPILSWVPALLAVMLVACGVLMVSRVRYVHVVSMLFGDRHHFVVLVWVVFALLLFMLAPVPALFLVFNSFAFLGLIQPLLVRRRARRERARRRDLLNP